MLFVDESGISLVPFVAKTWAPKGQTPVLIHRFSWPKLSMISGVTPHGKLYFRLEEGGINQDRVCYFLKQILRHVRRKHVMVFWDNMRSHTSSVVREFVKAHPRLEIHQLPPYFYDGNPDDGLWSLLKTKELANFCPQTVHELKTQTKKAVKRIRRKPWMVRSFFNKTPLYQSDQPYQPTHKKRSNKSKLVNHP